MIGLQTDFISVLSFFHEGDYGLLAPKDKLLFGKVLCKKNKIFRITDIKNKLTATKGERNKLGVWD